MTTRFALAAPITLLVALCATLVACGGSDDAPASALSASSPRTTSARRTRQKARLDPRVTAGSLTLAGSQGLTPAPV